MAAYQKCGSPGPCKSTPQGRDYHHARGKDSTREKTAEAPVERRGAPALTAAVSQRWHPTLTGPLAVPRPCRSRLPCSSGARSGERHEQRQGTFALLLKVVGRATRSDEGVINSGRRHRRLPQSNDRQCVVHAAAGPHRACRPTWMELAQRARPTGQPEPSADGRLRRVMPAPDEGALAPRRRPRSARIGLPSREENFRERGTYFSEMARSVRARL